MKRTFRPSLRPVLLAGVFALLSVLAFAVFTPPATVPYNAAAYADRAKLRNSTGMIGLGAYASPAACPAQVNLFSQNVSYSIPVLSLPGRAGLSLSLTLAYNSKVWIKSGNTIYFDGDKGWPAIGWRLGFGRIDGVYSGPDGFNHYYLISSDGSVRDLKYNAGSGLYESTDSTYMDFNDSTGILRHRDGTQIAYSALNGFVLPVQVKDRDGNFITINYAASGQNISSVVDTVGRTVSFSYNPDGTLATISKTGFGGAARTWSFGYTDITLTYNFGALAVSGPSSGSLVKVLSSITFPNGTKQTFTYNTYAQLSEAVSRSNNDAIRGKVLINWQATPGGGWSDSPTPSQVGHFDGSNTNYWSLAFNTYSTTVTDPGSVPRTTAFLQTGGWDDGLESQTTIGSPTVRTAITEWGQDGTLANPRVIRVTSILNDSGQQSKVEYDYTSYGNVSEVREYDFGLALIRRSTTTYVTDPNYTSRHILGLPSTTIVYDGGGIAKARTELAYDNAALVYAGGAANHDDANYGTGFVYRGLVTLETRYTNAAGPSGPITNSNTYDMLGNLRTESADCCVQRQYNFSATAQFSQPDSIVRGSGITLTTSATYDSNTGLVASSSDENNKVTSFNYDVMDRPTSTTRPDGTLLTTNYDDTSGTASNTSTTPIEAGKSVKQTTEFDGLGRTKRVITMDVSNNVYSKTDTLYDSLGRTWKVSNPYIGASASYWTETQYDALGRVLKIVPPDGSGTSNNISYAYSGNTVTATDQAGKQRKLKKDALGRQIEVTEPDPANNNSLTLVSAYMYDPLNNVTQITQGVQTRTYVFDGLSRKTSETTPEAGTVSYVYNNDSLFTQRTDARGVVTTYSHDGLNRLYQISYNTAGTTAAATPTVTYMYGTNSTLNNNGRLITMTDGVGEENYSYDLLGRMTQVQKKIYNVTYTASYAYNLAGEVSTMTYPSGRIVKRNYDPIGRTASIQNNATSAYYVSGASYNAASELTGLTYGNSVSTSRGYSAERLQLTSLSYTRSGQTLLSLSYGYIQAGGNNGQITQVTDSVQAGRTVSYTYDSLRRVKTAVTTGSVAYPKWGLSWTYDRYANRTAQTVTYGSAPSSSVAVDAATNRITSMGAFTFYYDSSGNLTQDDLFKYKYDAENRLVELRQLSDALVATYAFDGNSLRVVKVVGADRTFYLYAGTQLISEYEDAASNTYTPGTTPGQAPADSVSTVLYQHADQLTTRFTTDNFGNVGNEQGHYPYGESWYKTGTADPSVLRKFTSYLKDTETGAGQLNYATFREHSARIGRFHMADPVHGGSNNPQRLNRYAYVRNDTVNLIDPLGLHGCLSPTIGEEVPCPDITSVTVTASATGRSTEGAMLGGLGGGGQDLFEVIVEDSPVKPEGGGGGGGGVDPGGDVCRTKDRRCSEKSRVRMPAIGGVGDPPPYKEQSLGCEWKPVRSIKTGILDCVCVYQCRHEKVRQWFRVSEPWRVTCECREGNQRWTITEVVHVDREYAREITRPVLARTEERPGRRVGNACLCIPPPP